jgi:acyl-coenzyme A thioesterase PaaI-like protein
VVPRPAVRTQFGHDHHPQLGTATGLVVGTVLGTAAGVALAWSRSAWGSFVTTRFLLAARKDLPLRLMAFLKDAHRRGVLRRVGAYYDFRHQELQQALAAEAP